MDRIDKQEKTGYVLQGEIRILEKRKEDLQRSLDLLNASKKAQITEFTNAINLLKAQREQLIKQVESLRQQKEELSSAPQLTP